MLRALLAAATLALAVTTAPALAGAPASADGCGASSTDPFGTDYGCSTGGTPGGDPATPGTSGGSSSQPTCNLQAPATWCNGPLPCYTIDWHPPFIAPEGDKPSPDAKAYIDECLGPSGYQIVRIYWSTPGDQEPPLQEQAVTATGQLRLQLPPLVTNPVDRTLVNLPTWFWIDGGQAEQIGTSAFGLRAIATIASLHIDTGDGDGIDCPWTTTRAQAEESCTYTYMRASNDGTATVDGHPAYTVTATSTWDVRFELNGVRVEIPGAPTTLQGPPSTALLRVAESQAVVNDTH